MSSHALTIEARNCIIRPQHMPDPFHIFFNDQYFKLCTIRMVRFFNVDEGEVSTLTGWVFLEVEIASKFSVNYLTFFFEVSKLVNICCPVLVILC